jgi:hypothetical protein
MEADRNWLNCIQGTINCVHFGSGDRDNILNQLSNSNRMILPSGVRGIARIIIKCKYFHDYSQGLYYLWLSNDERRRIIKELSLMKYVK